MIQRQETPSEFCTQLPMAVQEDSQRQYAKDESAFSMIICLKDKRPTVFMDYVLDRSGYTTGPGQVLLRITIRFTTRFGNSPGAFRKTRFRMAGTLSNPREIANPSISSM